MTQNQIAYQAHLENKRANEARETETHRSNIANEEENKRYHTESVKETQRSNKARETETNRSNLANEMLKATEIRTRSEDNRYSADLGYQGRVDAAYINKWGVSKSDASSLASTIGSGVRKAMPGATGVVRAAVDVGNALVARVATAPIRAVIDTASNVKQGVDRIVQKTNKSTVPGRSSQRQNKTNLGGHNYGKKKFKQQKF